MTQRQDIRRLDIRWDFGDERSPGCERFLKDLALRRVLEEAGTPMSVWDRYGTSPRPPSRLPERVSDINRHFAGSVTRDAALAGRVSLSIMELKNNVFPRHKQPIHRNQ